MNGIDSSKMATQLWAVGTDWLIKVGGVLVALFVAWVVAGWVRRAIRKSLEKRSFDTTLTRFFANLARYAILTVVVVGCLGVFGIQTTSFAALVAALGLAVGLAFQGTLGNFAAGIMLLIFRPYKVGDYVRAGGEMGSVEEIELFFTELKTPDNRRVIVPNGPIFAGTIENFSHYDMRRCGIPVGVEYGADIDRTREVLEGAVKTMEGVLDEPAPQIFLKELGGSSVDWEVRVWVKTSEYWDVHQRGVRAVKKALDEAGLGIPFPQMDVHLDDPVVKALGK